MKCLVRPLIGALLGASLISSSSARAVHVPNPAETTDFDSGTRLIFFAVLEGLYNDGLSSVDVDRILMKKNGSSHYEHFIYSCPICTPTIWALETYRQHPSRFYSLKTSASTFGPGLSGKLHSQLYSDDSYQRLMAINSLVNKWISGRLAEMNLPKKQRATLIRDLEAKRKKGMQALDAFRKDATGSAVADYAPDFQGLAECAACNGAIGRLMKFPAASPSPALQGTPH